MYAIPEQSEIEVGRVVPVRRRLITHCSTIPSRTSSPNPSRRFSRLTKEDYEFIKLYARHFPRTSRFRPRKRRFKKNRKNVDADDSDQNHRKPGSMSNHGHTYELAAALCKLKERPLAAGVQGQMKLIGALRKLDRNRECAWKCWLQCAMRREADHINKMRISIAPTRIDNLHDVGPDWFQQLSWEQMESVNILDMTLYQDIDEGVQHRTQALLQRIGLYPPPTRNIIKRVMKISKDDPCKFLIELYKLISPNGVLPGEAQGGEDSGEEDHCGLSQINKDDEENKKKKIRTGFEYSLDERIILSALAHLRTGSVLDHLDEEYGKANLRLPYFKMIDPPCPKRKRKSGTSATWPYLQPLYIPEYNWLEVKLIQDAIYAQNLYMSMHRVSPPVPPKLRPVPFTHIEIPEELKPRKVERSKEKRTSEDTGATKTVMSSKSAATSPGASRPSTRASAKQRQMCRFYNTGVDRLSQDFYPLNRRKHVQSCRANRRYRPSVLTKSKRHFIRRLLKGIKNAPANPVIDECFRPTPQFKSHPRSDTFDQKPHLKKLECPKCECNKKKVAETGEKGVSDKNADDKRKYFDRADVLACLEHMEDEPLGRMTNTEDLPAIQKWLRIKNGLTYVHPVMEGKIVRRTRKIWKLMEGGKCSLIKPPNLHLTKKEERKLTWDHHGWLRKETNRIQDEFYRTCYEMQIAVARELYPSMATDFFARRDKFLQIYFKYMPARPQDCMRFPWEKSEYNMGVFHQWKLRFDEMQEARKREQGKA